MEMRSTAVNESCFEPPSPPAFFELARAGSVYSKK